jgi:hypothetical protein
VDGPNFSNEYVNVSKGQTILDCATAERQGEPLDHAVKRIRKNLETANDKFADTLLVDFLFRRAFEADRDLRSIERAGEAHSKSDLRVDAILEGMRGPAEDTLFDQCALLYMYQKDGLTARVPEPCEPLMKGPEKIGRQEKIVKPGPR